MRVFILVEREGLWIMDYKQNNVENEDLDNKLFDKASGKQIKTCENCGRWVLGCVVKCKHCGSDIHEMTWVIACIRIIFLLSILIILIRVLVFYIISLINLILV